MTGQNHRKHLDPPHHTGPAERELTPWRRCVGDAGPAGRKQPAHLHSAVWLQTGVTSALSYLMTLSFHISQIRRTCQLITQIGVGGVGGVVGGGGRFKLTPSLGGFLRVVNTAKGVLPVITPSTVRHAPAAADSLHGCGAGAAG